MPPAKPVGRDAAAGVLLSPPRATFVHTEIAPAVRRQHLHLTPRCPFIRAFIERNPEYGELVAVSPRTYYPSDR